MSCSCETLEASSLSGKGNNGLLKYKTDIFTQNGEDGVVEKIFQEIGAGKRKCCEFGAWDGVRASNCRRLILEGWKALMIEGDHARCKELERTYLNNPDVKCVECFVDCDRNSIGSICRKYDFEDLDLLSVDIDGFDYQICESLDIMPRVIVVEINAGHAPESEDSIPVDVAKNNVGQPFGRFVRWARLRGYCFVCYTGNAFFVRSDCLVNTSLRDIGGSEAYDEFISNLDRKSRSWLFMVNLGLAGPLYRFGNPRLGYWSLGLGVKDIIQIFRQVAKKTGWPATMRRFVRTFCMAVAGKTGSVA